MRLFALSLTAFLLQGCGNKVDCNSSKVKSDALDIIQSNLGRALWYQQIGAALSGSPELSNIRTISRDDELKQAQCRATYTYTYNGKPREADVTYTLAYLQDKGEVDVRVVIGDVYGAIAGLVSHESPIKNGLEKILDPATGNLQHTIEWKNGVQDGEEKLFNPATGKVIAQANFTKGQKTGSQKVWSSDGSTQLIDLTWEDGKATGYEKQYDASGTTLLTDLTWKDGKASGVQTTGNLQATFDEYHLKDGVYDGIHKSYVAGDGANNYKPFLAKTENFKDGKLNGLTQEFSETGDVTAERYYKDGVEISTNPPTPAAQ